MATSDILQSVASVSLPLLIVSGVGLVITGGIRMWIVSDKNVLQQLRLGLARAQTTPDAINNARNRWKDTPIKPTEMQIDSLRRKVSTEEQARIKLDNMITVVMKIFFAVLVICAIAYAVTVFYHAADFGKAPAASPSP